MVENGGVIEKLSNRTVGETSNKSRIWSFLVGVDISCFSECRLIMSEIQFKFADIIAFFRSK